MAAKRSRSKTALRGAVNNVIMESLIDGEKYGYEIIKEVEEKTNGKIKLKQPSLYSSLKRFEAKGYIESHWQDSDIGGKRHYYKLTPAGISYYKKHIAKEIEDDFEEVDDDIDITSINNDIVSDEYLEDQILSEYEIDEHEENADFAKYEYNVDAQLDSLLKNDSPEDDLLDELYNEINDSNTVVYTEDDIQKEFENQNSVIADHEFRTPTPLTNHIELSTEEISDNALNDIMHDDEDNNDIFDDITLSADENDNTSTNEVKTSARIITDENGITKMYYEDTEEKKQNSKVFDNVVLRTTTQNLYASLNNTKSDIEKALTDEEKELKSKRFFEKFDSKSEQIMKEKQQAKANEPKQEQVDNNIDYNYKSKLNKLFDITATNDDDDTYDIEETNLEDNYSNQNYDYDNDESVNDYLNTEDVDDRSKDYTMKVYTEEKAKDPTIKYLQINKAKFSFGLCMLVFMLLQVTIMLVVFKNRNMLMDNQFWIFQVSYLIVGLVALTYCIPVFISPNKQASNNFKLGYSLMFGTLAFFIVVILAYAINTFMGMELFNIQYYLSTLLVPIVLSLNFIFGPLIYWVITQSKRFY